MSTSLNRIILGSLVGLASLGAGCAGERDPVDRVQPDAIPKSFLIGQKLNDPTDDPEFHARSMLVGVDYGSAGGGLFSAGYNSVSRIRWSVEQDFLLGRLSFERIKGTGGQGTAKGIAEDPRDQKTNDGEVVYKFRITSHFDIRRDFNPATGEENNVRVENTTDRPWYDREYIRVDWTQNLNTSAYKFDTLSFLGILGVEYTNANFTANNPNFEDRPTYDFEGGYLDATAKIFARPKMIEEYGIPACWVPPLIGGGTEPVESCNEHQLTVRHSFKRVVNNDYEPMDWDGKRFEMYGAFTTDLNSEVGVFDREYGLRDSGRTRAIERYNPWKRSHIYSNPETMEGAKECRTDGDCSDEPGSRCDNFRGINNKCTLPLTKRETKPIVFHYVHKGDMDYFDATQDSVSMWDAAMRQAIAAGRQAECKKYGISEGCGIEALKGNFAAEEDLMYLVSEGTACRNGKVNDGNDCEGYIQQVGEQRGYSAQVIEMAKQKPMAILCHSPVADKDAEECGPKGTIARMGDFRFNIINAVAQPEVNGPWGIMTDATDPETGEKISTNVTSYVAINDSFAAQVVDTLRYVAGEIKTSDVSNGNYIINYRAAIEATAKGMNTPLLTKSELNQRIVSSIDGADIKDADKIMEAAKALQAKNPDFYRNLREEMKVKTQDFRSVVGAPSANAPLYQARREMIKNTPVEAALVTPAMMQLAGVTGTTQADMDVASPIRGLNPTVLRDLRHKKEVMFAQQGMCELHMESPSPLSFIGMRGMLEEKFGKFNPGDSNQVQAERAAKMKSYVRRMSHTSVMAHELGHSFGLRHNFVSSTDALNFRAQYWQLRTSNGKVTAECTDKVADGKACVGPRWFDPVTDDEANGILNMWAQSSVMEYPGEIAQDFIGLGRYDFAAARMFYGDTVSVLAGNDFKSTQPKGKIFLDHGTEFGGLLGFTYNDGGQEAFHYSQLQTKAGLISGCKDVDVNNFKPQSWDEERNGAWNPTLDGHLVKVDGKYQRCNEPELDFVPYTAMKSTADTAQRGGTPATQDETNRVRWTHGFATDQWADLGNVAVYRHDNGTDLYEQMNFWIAQQETTHIFDNYRRGRRAFDIRGAFNRAIGRYHEKMRDAAKGLGLYTTLARETVVAGGTSFGADPKAAIATLLGFFPANAVASAIAFDHFTHVHARPQPGPHAAFGVGKGTPFAVARSCDDVGFGVQECSGRSDFTVPNGVTGDTLGFKTLELAGRPVNNDLAANQGRDYNSDYFTQVGSYYEKAYVPTFFAESADNFISSSRGDFVDPRYRAVSMTDVYPDAFRRWLGNTLTGDEFIKGVRAKISSSNIAQFGWTSWWPSNGPRSCFPSGVSTTCFTPGEDAPAEPAGLTVVDAQVGWEQQRFAYVFSLLYLLDNQRTNWLDQMQIWEIGMDNDPGFNNRVEFRAPNGKTYVARSFGTEVIFGKTVEKGIAGRVLEYANELMRDAFTTVPVVRGGRTVGYEAVLDVNGRPTQKVGTTCSESAACTRLESYQSIPAFMRTSLGYFGKMSINGLKGVY